MKFKKFFIVPVVSLLLLLAYPFSSALAADEDYFLPSGSLGFDEFEDLDFIHNYVFDAFSNSSQASSYPYADCPYYFYSCDMSTSMYESTFLPRSSGTCSFYFVYYISNFDTPLYEDSDYILFPIDGIAEFIVTFSSDFSTYSIEESSVYYQLFDFSFTYNKHTGSVDRNNGRSIPNYSDFSPDHPANKPRYIFMQSTNIPGFTLAEGVNSGGSGFDVSVSFNPVLQNTVNMTTVDNGVSTLSNYFNMSVRNNGRKSIQFFMAITEPGTNVFTGHQGVYNDYGENVRFVYSSDEWIDQIDEFDVTGVNNTYVSALRRSEWHRVDPLQQVNRNFAWSQMSLQKDHLYDVVVYAMPTREGSTNVSIMHELPAFDWSSCAEVYRSSFKLPVSTKYDPNDNSFGNYANSSGDTMSHSNFSAYIDDNGKVQVPGDGKYFTADDIRNRYSQGSVSSSSPGSVSSDLNSVASNFHTFFEFINRIFSYFPRGYQAVITAGLTSIIVLGIIKVVLR